MPLCSQLSLRLTWRLPHSLMLMCCAVALGGALTASAHAQGTNIEQLDSNRPSAPPRPPRVNPVRPSPPPRATPSRPPSRPRPPQPEPEPAPETAPMYEVTFITERPGTSIYINGKPVAISSFDRIVKTQLAARKYDVVTSGANQITRLYKITIPAENTTINIALLKPFEGLTSANANAANSGARPSASDNGNGANRPSANNNGANNAENAAPADIESNAPPPTNNTMPPSSSSSAIPPSSSTTAPNDSSGTADAPVTVEPSFDPIAVIERYLDAKRTTSVTTDDWRKVVATTEEALQIGDNAKIRSMNLFAKGQLAYLAKDYATAAVLFNNARLAVPDSALTYYGLGNNLLATNQADAAFETYQRAAQINPQLALAYKGLGDAATKLNREREAISYYDRARQLGYESSDFNLNLARNHLKAKRYQQALDALTPVAQTSPAAEVYALMGDAYTGLKQPSSALSAYRKSTELDTKSASGFYKQGEILFGLNEFPQAIEALERALAIDTDGKIINRNRAREFIEKANRELQKRRGK